MSSPRSTPRWAVRRPSRSNSGRLDLHRRQSAANAGYQLNVTGDTTQRGTTGMSFTQLFGIGIATSVCSPATASRSTPRSPHRRSASHSRKPQITADDRGRRHDRLARRHAGARAAECRQQHAELFSRRRLGAQTSSLGDYAASFYQDVATRSQAASHRQQTTQDDRLQEAQTRQSSNSGVNLDEELTNMMTYQQAYSAGARMLTVVQQLYDTLLQIQ